MVRAPRAALKALRGFITIPGLLSLWGLALGVVLHVADYWLDKLWPGVIPAPLAVTAETARTVLSVGAGAAMSALVMVYSIVLLIYTMAASSIGPRLLQRFGNDRINQVAVGSLGATVLYCLLGLWLMRETGTHHLTAAVAVMMVVVSVLLLMIFVNTVASRVTIDREAARISRTLDEQLDHAMSLSHDLSPEEVVLPRGPERAVKTGETGYVDMIDLEAVAGAAAEIGATVVYRCQPGDFVAEGEALAHVIGDPDGTLDETIVEAAPLIEARDPEGDLRFSVHLLVEIALRALSPGVNDTYTAIACVDRLSASLVRAWRGGLRTGLRCDDTGAARVLCPAVTSETMFLDGFPPLRRSARGNGLMVSALTRALTRVAMAAPLTERAPVIAELRLLREGVGVSDLLAADRERLEAEIDAALERAGAEATDAVQSA